jgi:Raf kinase inhibitor-like YbhB/YbcL family protein
VTNRSIACRRTAWLCALAGAAILAGCDGDEPAATGRQASSMRLTSNAFENGQPLPAEYTCDGPGHSPRLQWSEPPAGTESFALVVDDPNAPGGTFGHWGVYDIPMSARQIDTGAAQNPDSDLKQAENDFGKAGYGPPCPPRGDPPHHYRFRLVALDLAKLSSAPAKVEDIAAAAGDHVLGSAELVATYGRK